MDIPETKRRICALTAAGSYISEISSELDVTQSTIREWLQQDPQFRVDFQDARGVQTDLLEKEAVRRARDGVEEVVIYQGRVVMIADPDNPDEQIPLKRRNYSDTMLMFLLKGQRREIYGDKVESDNRHSVNIEGARERLAAKFAGLAQRLGADEPPRED